MHFYIGTGFVKAVLALVIVGFLIWFMSREQDKKSMLGNLALALVCLLLWFGVFSVLSLWM